MLRSRSFLVGAAAAAALLVSACSEEDRDDLGDTADSVLDDVEDAARTAASEIEEAAGEVTDDVAETAARNIATQQGEEQFADAGAPLDEDGLSCEATVGDDATTVDVSCTGMTEDGKQAALTGATNELPGASVTELEGQFSGTVDSEEVFSADRLGG